MIRQFTLQYLASRQEKFYYMTFVREYQKRFRALQLKQIEEEYVYISKDSNGFIREAGEQSYAEVRELTVDKQLELFGKSFGNEEELRDYYLQMKSKTSYIQDQLAKWDEFQQNLKEKMYLLLDSKETAAMFAKATNCAQLMECLAQLE